MRVPLTWLHEYLDFDQTASELVDLFSLAQPGDRRRLPLRSHRRRGRGGGGRGVRSPSQRGPALRGEGRPRRQGSPDRGRRPQSLPRRPRTRRAARQRHGRRDEAEESEAEGPGVLRDDDERTRARHLRRPRGNPAARRDARGWASRRRLLPGRGDRARHRRDPQQAGPVGHDRGRQRTRRHPRGRLQNTGTRSCRRGASRQRTSV